MFQPLGFERCSVNTSLGRMIYYTNTGSPWQDETTAITDKETLVFLHGFGGGSSAYEWFKVYSAFAAEYRIIAPDLIGWGESEHPERNYQVEDYLTTIREFLQQTSDGAVKVIASSLTAAFTIRVAISNPELFKSLILTTPAGLSDFGENYSRSFFAQLISTPVLDKLFYTAGVATSGGIRSFLEQRQFANSNRVYKKLSKLIWNLQNSQMQNMRLCLLFAGIYALIYRNILNNSQYLQQLFGEKNHSLPGQKLVSVWRK